MANNEDIVLQVNDYNQVDGKFAYTKKDKKILVGCEEAGIILKITEDGQEIELPFHRVLDLALVASKSLVYFQEAYRHPKLYDPNNPIIGKIGLQGSNMTLAVNMENKNIDQAIDQLSREINEQGELIGERIRMISEELEELGY